MPTPTLTPCPFLAAVLADPASDAPRLQYADYLEGLDGVPIDPARGEFIRVQCALARLLSDNTRDCVTSFDCGGDGICRYCTQAAVFRRRERALLWSATPCYHGFNHYEKRLTVADCKQCQANQMSRLGFTTWGGLWLGEPFMDDGWPPREMSWTWQWKRGFVSAVTLPCRDWCGAPCGRCDRTGWVVERVGEGTGAERDTCPACRGAGRTAGHGPRIVRAAPLETVTISDRKPQHFNLRGQGHFWQWQTHWTENKPWIEEGDRPWILPHAIFNRVVGFGKHLHRFPTEAAALAALSAAAIHWARSRP